MIQLPREKLEKAGNKIKTGASNIGTRTKNADKDLKQASKELKKSGKDALKKIGPAPEKLIKKAVRGPKKRLSLTKSASKKATNGSKNGWRFLQ